MGQVNNGKVNDGKVNANVNGSPQSGGSTRSATANFAPFFVLAAQTSRAYNPRNFWPGLVNDQKNGVCNV